MILHSVLLRQWSKIQERHLWSKAKLHFMEDYYFTCLQSSPLSCDEPLPKPLEADGAH